MSNRNGGGGRVRAKVENPPKVSKSASRKLCKKLASITTENQICGQNWSDSGKRRENDGLVVYGNGLIVYGKQKRQTHCRLSLLGALVSAPQPVVQEGSSSSLDDCKEP